MTMAYVGIALTVISAATTAYGQKKAADAAEETGEMQKKAADQTARNLELQNAENIRRQRANNRRSLARMRTAMAGTSGLTFDGTMEDAFLETAGQMELQVQDSAREGSMEAANSRSAGNMALWEARTTADATRIQSYGTMLSGAASATGKLYQAGDITRGAPKAIPVNG